MTSEEAPHLEITMMSNGDGTASGSKPEPASSAPSGDGHAPGAEASVAEEDLGEGFVPENRLKQSKGGTTNKDAFLPADLVVPSTALKKMKQAMSGSLSPSHFVALLGSDVLKMRKTEKPGVKKMILANMSTHADIFWERAATHIDGTAAAILLPDTSALAIPAVACQIPYCTDSSTLKHSYCS